jgi:hypothetical protein
MSAATRRDEACRLLGELATTFAGIEHSVGELLNRLIKGSLLTLPVLIDRLPLSQAIDGCKKAAEYFFRDSPEQLDKVKELLKKLHRHRERRNLFIHGQWTIDDSGSACISSFRLRREEEGPWEYLKTNRMSLSDLRRYRDEVGQIRSELFQFVESLPNPLLE